jgi:hypothetical protein
LAGSAVPDRSPTRTRDAHARREGESGCAWGPMSVRAEGAGSPSGPLSVTGDCHAVRVGHRRAVSTRTWSDRVAHILVTLLHHALTARDPGGQVSIPPHTATPAPGPMLSSPSRTTGPASPVLTAETSAHHLLGRPRARGSLSGYRRRRRPEERIVDDPPRGMPTRHRIRFLGRVEPGALRAPCGPKTTAGTAVTSLDLGGRQSLNAKRK